MKPRSVHYSTLLFIATCVLSIYFGKSAEAIHVPCLSKENMIGTVSGLRPYKDSGFLISTQILGKQNKTTDIIRIGNVLYRISKGGKLLIHNFGHGGSGLGFSLGSAELAVNHLLVEMNLNVGGYFDPLFKVNPLGIPGDNLKELGVHRSIPQSLNSASQIAVLGAGVNGLAVAYLLTKLGFTVTIYAEKHYSDTVSNKAGGLFSPCCVQETKDLWEHQKHTWVQSRSYNLLLELAGAGIGISPMRLYTALESLAGMEQLPKGLIPPVKTLNPLPFPGTKSRNEKGYLFETILIDTPHYLNHLHSNLIEQGVEMNIGQQFRDIQDVMDIKEKILFNTLGLGSTLFGFNDLHPVRGDLVHYKPDPDLTYMVFHKDKYVFPQKDKMVVGGSFKMYVRHLEPDHKKNQAIIDENRIWLHGK